jgi:hypothetical protein
VTDPRPLIAYRYSVPDIERWPDAVVQIFANHLRTKETSNDR